MAIFRNSDKMDFLQVLVDAAKNTLHASHLFREAMNSDSHPASYFPKMKELENIGDDFTHNIYRGLNQVFMTPLDREDILELATKLDDVLDGIEASLARFDYLDVDQPDEYMRQFANVLVSSCEHMLEAFRLLSRKKFLQIHEFTTKINTLENEGDRLMREGIRSIFQNPTDPYRDFKLKELYERLEATTDACEDVADILESVVLRYA